MTEHWEISHLSFDGELKDKKIVCQNCGWSWDLKDGGNDPYVCHSCGSDNSRFYLGNETYSNAVDPNLIVQGVSSLASVGGSIAQSKAQKEASKTDVQREIETRCGKDKSRALLKKKKNAYNECKAQVLKTIDADKQFTKQQLIEQKQEKKKQEELLKIQSAQRQQSQKNQTYIIIGLVVAVVVGFVIYKKRNK